MLLGESLSVRIFLQFQSAPFDPISHSTTTFPLRAIVRSRLARMLGGNLAVATGTSVPRSTTHKSDDGFRRKSTVMSPFGFHFNVGGESLPRMGASGS